MAQVNIRATDELADRWRQAARESGKSLNAWVVAVLSAAVDPNLAGSEAAQVRERLRRAGLLMEVPPSGVQPPDPDLLARARAAAGRGRPLSEFVREGRE